MPADPKKPALPARPVTSTGLVMVTGEIRTQAYIDVDQIVRETIREIGYTRAKFGFDGNTCGVVNAIHEQTPDIAQGVDASSEFKRRAARTSSTSSALATRA